MLNICSGQYHSSADSHHPIKNPLTLFGKPCKADLKVEHCTKIEGYW